jgi:tRNA A-37 threonylcarbamoyl transferase component Bud32
LSLSIPTTIGRYSIERLLGQGAMGSVYLGRDPELDRAVAIKTVKNLDLEESRLKTFLERFRNEARAAGRLSHPAIVAVYDVGEDPNVGPYLVFEYVAGSTLKQILRGRGPLAPAAAVRLARQLAAALDTAHAAGVIHRDIKPDNILVSAAGDAKLADFGVARVPDAALTKEGQFLGTPCYAAPETLEDGRYGPHSDLFSFAAVLYEMVTAVRAFPGDDAISVAHHVVHDHPKAPSEVVSQPGVPKQIDVVLARALSKEPEKRYTSASELVDALHRAYITAGLLREDTTGVQPLAAPEPPASSRAASWAFLLILIGGLAVGTVLVVVFGDWGEADDVPIALPPTDAGVVAIDAGPIPIDAGIAVPLLPDAGAPHRAPDAGAPAPSADAGIEAMSAFDREQTAKDRIRDARRFLEQGDTDAAQRELDLARAYDPRNDDIPSLEQAIRAATGS